MKRIPIILVSLSLLCLAWALDAAPQVEIKEAPITWQQASLGDGEALFAELCASCHGIDAKGNGPAAPALSTPPPDLTQLARYNDGTFPAKQVEKSITGELSVTAHGSLQMPVWGKVFEDVRPDKKPGDRYAFSRRRIYDLTTYIATLQVEESQ